MTVLAALLGVGVVLILAVLRVMGIGAGIGWLIDRWTS